MRKVLHVVRFTTFVLTLGFFSFVHTQVVLTPYGITMCNLKCQQTTGCHRFAYKEDDLICCFKVYGQIPTFCSDRSFRIIVLRTEIKACESGYWRGSDTPCKIGYDCIAQKGLKVFYKGTMSQTRTGMQCKRWDSTSLSRTHQKNKNGFLNPGETIQGMGNSCRNPGVGKNMLPWCYTMSKKTRWQFCRIDQCQPMEDNREDCYVFHSKNTKRGAIDDIFYNGKRNTTVSGYPCQRWDRQVPHRHTITGFTSKESLSESENYCRTTSTSPHLIPWCYTTNTRKIRDFCGVPEC